MLNDDEDLDQMSPERLRELKQEVLLHIDGIADAFKSWNIIREEAAAQAYLVSMLPSKERKQSERPRPEKRPTLADNSKSSREE